MQLARSAATLLPSFVRTSGDRRLSAERRLVLAACATSKRSPGDSRTVSGMYAHSVLLGQRFRNLN
jgi:hypothetical protein